MEFTFAPIGVVRGGGIYPQEAPRQGVLAHNTGVIELFPGRDFEMALTDIKGFERIWVIFVFDRVQGWKPKVHPPDGADSRRIGLFATRSPHRPNPIGISVVELDGLEGRKLYIRNFDILDATPVLDIKPYIPLADAFPDSAIGWRAEQKTVQRQLVCSPEVLEIMAFIRNQGGPDLENIARVQLATRTLDPHYQRLLELNPAENRWQLAFRTWRIEFRLIPAPPTIQVERISSGYHDHELTEGAPDPYHDLTLHRLVRQQFPQTVTP